MTSRLCQVAGLLVAAVLIGFGINALREEPLPLSGSLDPPPPPEPGADLVAAVATDALESWLEGAFFLDARSRDEWEETRVAGSWSLDAEEFDGRYFDVGSLLDLDLPLFVYGAGPDSHAVRRTVAKLGDMGHSDVQFVVGGLEELLAAGLDPAEGPQEDAP